MLATFHTAMQLDKRNVLNILHEAKFSDGDWTQLGLQLIQHFDLTTIKADHDRATDCMIETISQWLAKDTKASWEKLADAVTKVGGYGEATAASVRENAEIFHTRMLTVRILCLMIIPRPFPPSSFDCYILEVIINWIVGTPAWAQANHHLHL